MQQFVIVSVDVRCNEVLSCGASLEDGVPYGTRAGRYYKPTYAVHYINYKGI